MLRTHQGDLSEVGVFTQEEHQGFCFRVSEPYIVLEDLGAILGYHETGEQNTNEREAYLTLGRNTKCVVGCTLAFSPHTVYGRL